MSLSRPEAKKAESPVNAYYRWNSQSKCFIDNQEKKEIKKLVFIVLDDSVKMLRGYNEAKGWGVYTNKIVDLRSQPFTLFNDGGAPLHPSKQSPGSGLYSEDKEKFAYHKAKYTQVMYVYVPNVGIVEIKASGAFLRELFEIQKTLGLRSFVGKVFVWEGGSNAHKKGVVEYHVPDFKSIRDADPDGAVYEEALNADKALQDYIDQTARKTITNVGNNEFDDTDEPDVDDDKIPETNNDDLPF